MKRVWLPTSPLGRYALWSAGAFLALIVSTTIVQSVTAPPHASRLALVWLTLAAAVAGAVMALIAILRDKDRAILTFVALVPAVFSLLFELVFE
jgi:hypothetical protein